MTGLLELREKIKSIYSKNEVFILPVVKFLFAFLTLNTINSKMGYMTQIDNTTLVLIVALLCSFMPTGCPVFFASAFTLLHMYALSLETAVVGLVVYLLLFIVFLRFASKDTLAVIVTPLLCGMQMPYVVPIVMGLVGTPASAISVGCGVIVYYFIRIVLNNASTISTMGDEEAIAKIRLLIDAMLDNKEMMIMVMAFAITVIVVYLIRRMSIDYAWTIAMIAGVMVNLVLLLVGDLMYDTNMSVVNALLGAVLAILVAKVIEFFRFCVDYSRTEKVQFEDDEYYYYVKAIPKMTVAAPTKTVKRINAQHTREAAPTRTAGASGRGAAGGNNGMNRTSASGRETTPQRREGATVNSQRSVITERTAASRNISSNNQPQYNRKDRMNNGRSVTINSNQTQDDDTTEFEELF